MGNFLLFLEKKNAVEKKQEEINTLRKDYEEEFSKRKNELEEKWRKKLEEYQLQLKEINQNAEKQKIEQERLNQERKLKEKIEQLEEEKAKKGKEKTSSIQSQISSFINHPGTKYKLRELKEVGYVLVDDYDVENPKIIAVRKFKTDDHEKEAKDLIKKKLGRFDEDED